MALAGRDDVLANLAERLNYLLRAGEGAPVPHPTVPITAAADENRRLVRIRGVGRATKDPKRLLDRAASSDSAWRLPTEDLLAGLHQQRVPLVFRLSAVSSGVSIEIGTWSGTTGVSPAALDQRLSVLMGVLGGLYAQINYHDVDPAGTRQGESGGALSLGLPVSKAPHGSEYLAPIERVIEVVRGSGCGVTVVAHPVRAENSARTRNALLGEIQAVQSAVQSSSVPGPLAEQYLQVLADGLKLFAEGAATGMWRTAVYLTGDADFRRVASTWQSVYSAPSGLFEPLQVVDWGAANDMAQSWAMPDLAGCEAPGLYRRPFRHQTLLTSRQVAAYVHLPEQEVPGFAVTLLPAFDSVRNVTAQGRSDGSERQIRVGTILHRLEPTHDPYVFATDHLSRHALVCGVTGAGKTTTILWMLRQLAAQQVPYLVVEPVKTEYRVLVTDQTPSSVRLFTAGNNLLLPLTINPFEVPNGTSLAVHVDRLRALFTAAFTMWDPLPQILERCLHEVYADRGWSMLTGENNRLKTGDDRTDSWPTLTDLAEKVDDVIGGLGYSGEVTSNMRSALSTRIEGLRAGAKGAMLDTTRSISADLLFETPVVLELEALGADEDRAFVMGLLLIRLAEHRRTAGQSRSLRHVLVLEEAHRLLSRPAAVSSDQGTSKGKAVDAFVDMLAEIRAYGQAVVVADQVPVRLAPEVLKNTDLKIMQRTVAATDRAELAAACAMTDDQSQVLATLERGQAAVYSEGDDSPILVKVGPADQNWRGQSRDTPDDEEARQRSRRDGGDPSDAAPSDMRRSAAGKELGRSAGWRAAVGRFAVCACEDQPAALLHHHDFRDLLGPAMTGDPVIDDACVAAAVDEAAGWLSRRRGAQSGWNYQGERSFRDALSHALRTVVSDAREEEARAAVGTFAEVGRGLHTRHVDPYPACAQICPSSREGRLCLYRRPAADALLGVPTALADGIRGNLVGWTNADVGWAAAAGAGVLLAGRHAIGLEPGTIARRAALCLSQQAHASRVDLLPAHSRESVQQVIVSSGLVACDDGGAG